ncbi:MAG: proline dehydrogenase family protein [Phycisphaerales bacterium]|nr:proline dehydrogenase family protein [Phycisphaerales bacterium]
MAIFSRKPKPVATSASQPVAPRPAHALSASSADEPRVLDLGREMLDRARKHKTGLLSARFYSDKLMEWSMQDQAFKVQLFRFVDAFPMLKSPEDIFEHLQDYLTQPGVKVPAAIDLGLKAGGIAKGLATKQITSQITGMASKFIAGTDAASALGNLKDLWNDGIAFSVDLLGEACVSEHEAHQYQAKYLDLVNNLPGAVAGWKPNPRLESDHLGPIPRTNVSIKISSLSARVDPIDTEGSIAALMQRIVPILEAAKAKGVFVNFDMEQRSLKDLTLELFMRCCEKVDFQAGLAMQAYLTSGEDDARRICEWSKRTGRVVSVRLVKGAYWDYEVIHAEQMGWPCPVWRTKRETDACFERMTDIFLDACPRDAKSGGAVGGGVKLALGSHNVRSIAYALAGLEKRGLPTSAIELQMLHGMADQLKHAAAEMNLRVREYVPVGEMIPGMAYLVRRLLENTSNESWLKAGFLDNADPAILLASPHGSAPAGGGGEAKPDLSTIAKERHALTSAVPGVGDGRPFFNESFRDFSQASVRTAYAAAVSNARVPEIQNTTTVEQARAMVDAADAAFDFWQDTDALKRAAVLTKAAQLMREKRDELSGIMIKEAGKTWREADADTCEAIDFCEFYAREAVKLFDRQRVGRFLGELDEVWYQPRGVSVVIAPWNFPLAICCGMTVAALVTGNPVIIKPAEQTPGIARALFDILERALAETFPGPTPPPPRGIVQLCPAPGETTGASLVRDPRVAVIAFTGSRDVGLDILSAAAPPSPFSVTPSLRHSVTSSLTHVKKVICEMGGKNAIIIDTSADLDEAVLAVRHSAFGFQGQKCSACSRLIVVDPDGENGPAIRKVIERIVEATKALTIGDPTKPGTDVGPVIDAEAQQKIYSYIEKAKQEGCKLELALPLPDSRLPIPDSRPLPFVPPHIFSNVKPTHTIAREEIFGPVLAIMHASTFEDALTIANGLPYKLTGGVFSRKPSHLERAKRHFRVGNLYLNRGITGALVARQPFGGFGMSGVGSKAGGTDYLLQFVEPRASCENTLRRGFAPEL